jgi:hypothetical protein
MKNILWVVIIFSMASCRQVSEKKTLPDYQSSFPDALNIKVVPESPDNLNAFGFSDMGAWHAYSLPHPDSNPSTQVVSFRHPIPFCNG